MSAPHLFRTNKQSYAILSDITGSVGTFGTGGLKTHATVSNTTYGSILTLNEPGIATFALRKDTLIDLDSAAGAEAGVNNGDLTTLRVNKYGALYTLPSAIRDDTLTTLTEVDGCLTTLRVNSLGALHTTTTPASAVGTQLVSYSSGTLYDGSYSNQLAAGGTLHTNLSYNTLMFTGMTSAAGVGVPVTLQIYVSHANDAGQTELSGTTDGSLVNTGMAVISSENGIFNATFNDFPAPYYTLKNPTGGPDVCLSLWAYGR